MVLYNQVNNHLSQNTTTTTTTANRTLPSQVQKSILTPTLYTNNNATSLNDTISKKKSLNSHLPPHWRNHYPSKTTLAYQDNHNQNSKNIDINNHTNKAIVNYPLNHTEQYLAITTPYCLIDQNLNLNSKKATATDPSIKKAGQKSYPNHHQQKQLHRQQQQQHHIIMEADNATVVEIKELQNAYFKLKKEYDKVSSRSENYKQDMIRLKSQVEGQQKQILVGQRMLERVISDKKTIEKREKEKRDYITKLEFKLGSTMNCKGGNIWIEKNEELKEKVSQYKAMEIDLKKDLHDKETELGKATFEISKLNKALSLKACEMVPTEKQAKHINSKYPNNYKNENDENTNRIQQATERLTILLKEAGTARAEAHNYAIQLAESDNRYHQTYTEMKELEIHLNIERENRILAQSNVEHLTSQLIEQGEELSKLQRLSENLNQEKVSLSSNVDDFHKKNRMLESLSSSIHTDKKVLEEDNYLLKTKLYDIEHKYQEEITLLKDNLAKNMSVQLSLEEQLQEERKRVRTLGDCMLEKDQRIHDLNVEVENFTNEIKIYHSKDALEKVLRRDHTDLESKTKQNNIDKSLLDLCNTSSTSILHEDQLQSNQDTTEYNIIDQEGNASILRLQTDKKNGGSVKTSLSFDMTSKDMVNNGKTNAADKKIILHLKKENHKLNNVLERKDKIESELKSDLNDLLEENRVLQQERDHALDEIDKLKLTIETGRGEEDDITTLKMEEIQIHVAKLEEELLKLHDAKMKMQKTLVDQISILKGDLKENEETIQQLESEKKLLRSSINMYKNTSNDHGSLSNDDDEEEIAFDDKSGLNSQNDNQSNKDYTSRESKLGEGSSGLSLNSLHSLKKGQQKASNDISSHARRESITSTVTLPEDLNNIENANLSEEHLNQLDKVDEKESDNESSKDNKNMRESHQEGTVSISSTTSHKSHRNTNSMTSMSSSTSLSLSSVRESIQQATQRRPSDQFACTITLLEITGLPNEEDNITAHMLHVSGNSEIQNGKMVIVADISLNGKVQSTSAIEVSPSTGRVKWITDQDEGNGKKLQIMKFVDSIRALRKPLLLSLYKVVPSDVSGSGQDMQQETNNLCCVENEESNVTWIGEKKFLCTLNPISIHEAMKNGGIFEVSPENIDEKKISDYKNVRIRGKVSMI